MLESGRCQFLLTQSTRPRSTRQVPSVISWFRRQMSAVSMHLAVDVELELARPRHSDPHRPRAEIAAQVIELPLDQVAAAVDTVHDLEVAAALVAADLLEEAHELSASAWWPTASRAARVKAASRSQTNR